MAAEGSDEVQGEVEYRIATHYTGGKHANAHDPHKLRNH